MLGVFLNGEAILDATPHGERIVDDSFLLLFNAWHEDMTFTLPVRRFGGGVDGRALHRRPGAAGRATGTSRRARRSR